MAKTLLRQFADILWPPRSLVSGARGIGKGPLTPAEFTSIPFISGPVCNACGSPAEIDLGADLAGDVDDFQVEDPVALQQGHRCLEEAITCGLGPITDHSAVGRFHLAHHVTRRYSIESDEPSDHD